MQNLFLKFFPPPKFLDPEYSGVSVSDTSIRFFQFEKRGDTISIKKYLERALPLGAIVSGYIHNTDEVIEVLKDIKKEIKTPYVRASLPEEKAYLFKTQIPRVAVKDIRSNIEFKLEENVPLPANILSFDFAVVDPKDQKKEHFDVVVSAIPSEVIDLYVEVFESAGFIPYSLEIESQAIARSLLKKTERGTYVIIHCAPHKVGLYIVSHGVIHFTSTVSTSLKGEFDPVDIGTELKKVVTFWKTSGVSDDTESKDIEAVFVTGEGFTEDFVSGLASNSKLSVSVGNVWINAFDVHKNVPEISFVDSVKYAPAIGLALPTHILI
ncbi:MAG: pilus assembly protein PilM [Candidatus Zambryskibacteria bacterium]|nr:pilus assembly protein PilM [Candidatus Zambryskibacteria bacterium]